MLIIINNKHSYLILLFKYFYFMKKKKDIQSLESKANQRAQNSILKQYEKEKILQFLNIADNSLQQKNVVNIDEPIFQPEPKVILFTDYEPLQLRTQILKLRNRDIVPRRVSIIHPETRLFQVTPFKRTRVDGKHITEEEFETLDMTNTKVASGMEVSYLIKFTPEAKVDVKYDLTVITEREKFVVPIIGIGCKVMLEFNEHLDFGEVPVKYKIEKPIILRNVGEKITKWKLKSNSSVISVSKKEGILEIGKSEQIICTFCPLEDREYEEHLQLNYDELEAIIRVSGRSKNDKVRLNKSVVELDPAYITKHSQSFVTIENNTAVPIEFSWKGNPSKVEEDKAKEDLFQKLARQEEEEKILNELQYDYEEAQGDRSFDIEDSYDEEEIIKINERHHIKNITIIARRFEKIRKCLMDDEMLFEDDNFQIEPLKGKIWPNMGMNICITFKPKDAIPYSKKAYCDVTGSQTRLYLEMNGVGIGPKAELTYNEKNLLDIPITSRVNIADIEPLIIRNIGVIDCDFIIRPSLTPCGKQFKFGLTEYKLKPPGEDNKHNGEKVIPIEFHAERLGEFSEKFIIEITRSKKEIPVVFKGHVIAPSCRFDLQNKLASNGGINFGAVSLKDKKYETVNLVNDSKVDIKFELRISSDSEDTRIETVFQLEPKNGIAKANSSIPIKITFSPEVEKAYDIVVLLDMEGIGFDMLTLPVSGECKIPDITINPSDTLSFDTVYIFKPETRKITLYNPDKQLTSQYDIENPAETNQNGNGSLQVYPLDGKIPPDGLTHINVTLTAEKLGPILLRLVINCKTKANSNNKEEKKQTILRIQATSKGPTVLTDKKALYFENVEVLSSLTIPIKLINTSEIEATYTAFMRKERSIFQIVQDRKGVIPACAPGVSETAKELQIKCSPDYQGISNENLFIKIENGNDLEIQLSCRAKGFCVIVDPDECTKQENGKYVIDFGTHFTFDEKIEKKILFINKGPKTQFIKWMKKEKKNPKNDEPKNSNIVKIDEKDVFTINGLTNNIGENFQSRSGAKFMLKAYSEINEPCIKLYDVFVAEPNASNSSSTEPFIRDLEIRVNFIKPYLTFSQSVVNFAYIYEKNINMEKYPKDLTLFNKAELPANFEIAAKSPFRVLTGSEYSIDKNGEKTIKIEFDPAMISKEKKTVKDMKYQLEIIHKGHPSKQFIDISVSCHFPNLVYALPSPNILNFGSILNDTYKIMTFDITNAADNMDVIYEWVLLEDENTIVELDKVGQTGKKGISSKKEQRKILLNEVFAIVPMNGILKPNSCETIRVTFTPGNDCEYNARLKCLIEGGPEEIIPLIGRASSISYKIFVKKNDTNEKLELVNLNKKDNIQEIYLGRIPFNKVTKIIFSILNDGKVDFNSTISYKTSEKLRYISINTHKCEIKADKTSDIEVEFMPGEPDIVDDNLEIEIAHFEPIVIKLKALGIYSSILMGLPRYDLSSKPYQLTDINVLFENFENDYKERKNQINLLDKNKKATKFKDNEAKTNIPKIGGDNITEIDKELEYNRIILHNKIKLALNEIERNNLASSTKQALSNNLQLRIEKIEEEMKKMTIAKYKLSFIDIVAGSSKEEKFIIYNHNDYDITVQLQLDSIKGKKAYFQLNPNKDFVLIPKRDKYQISIILRTEAKEEVDESTLLRVLIKDVKDSSFSTGKESGESYEVELYARVKQPDIKISNDELDFGNVFLGRKKIMKILIENNKNVHAKWNIKLYDKDNKPYVYDERRDEEFSITPVFGSLAPQNKQIITCSFVPPYKKAYSLKVEFEIQEGTSQFLILKGQAQELLLELSTNNISLEPVLPYYKYSVEMFELRNNNDIDIEVVSLDFDKKYLDEESLINKYRIFQKSIPNSSIDLPIREATSSLWPLFSNFTSKYEAKKKEIEEKAKTNQYSEALLKHMITDNKFIDFDDIEDEELFKYPNNIKAENKVNIIILGPKKCGKTTLCQEQRKTHKRGIVNLESILEWNSNNGFIETVNKVNNYIEERKKELEKDKAEREKILKQAKTNKKIKVEELIPIIDKQYTYYSKELWLELIKNRVSTVDANVGVVFDDLNSEFVENKEVMLEYLDEALKNQNIHVVSLTYPKDENGLDCCNWINFQYLIEQKKEQRKLGGKEIQQNNKKKPLANNINTKPKRGSNNNLNAILNTNHSNNTPKHKETKNKNKQNNQQNKKVLIRNDSTVSSLINIQNLPLGDLVDYHSKEFKFTSPNCTLSNEEKVDYLNFINKIEEKIKVINEKRLNLIDEEYNEKIRKIEEIKQKEEEVSKLEENNELQNISQNNEQSEGNKSKQASMIHTQSQIFEQPENIKVFRQSSHFDIEYYIPKLFDGYRISVPAPVLPKEEDLPIPPPEEYQIIKKITRNYNRNQVKFFKLKSLNPEYCDPLLNDIKLIKEMLIEEDKNYDEKVKELQAIMKDPKKKKAYEEEKKKKEKEKEKATGKQTSQLPFDDEPKKKEILVDKTRWIIPKKSSVPVFICFFSKEVLKEEKIQILGFEVVTYPAKEVRIEIKAKSDYPSLNTTGLSIKKQGIMGLAKQNRKLEEDFGYLLTIKDANTMTGQTTNLNKYNNTHLKVLRFPNDGNFDLEVKFVFLSQLNQEYLGFNIPLGSFTTTEQENESGTNFNSKDKDKKKQNLIVEPVTPFILTETTLSIQKGETKSLQIYCFPTRPVDYKDELLCLIKNNPVPIQIGLYCKGCEPKIDLDIENLEFEKLIVNQSSTKSFRLRNSGEIPCSWTISNSSQIPKQFVFIIVSGIIDKKQDVVINVNFSSDYQDKFQFSINIDCEDNLGYGVKVPTKTIKIQAESFKVSVEPIINTESKVLDFGNIKVKDYKSIPFSLKNHGIYKVKFKFEINPNRKLWQELFKFEPCEGEIEAGKDRNILALCLPYSKDISINNKSTEIKLIIFEGEKNLKYQEIPLFVNVASFFSKYTINPLKNINFGSLQFNEVNTRFIEIINEGQFEFNYDISEYLDESIMKKIKEEKLLKEIEEQKIKDQEIKDEVDFLINQIQNNKNDKKKPVPVTKPAEKKDDKNKKNKENENSLKINRFILNNFKGTIPPGSSSKIDIQFVGEGHKFYQNVLSIDISGRQPDDNPFGIPFDLVGESCIPGIETKDYDNIFEEQTVMPSLHSEINKLHIINSSIYSIEEKVFWFGTVIASKNPNGVTERFKIINPNKIACTVKIYVKPRTNSKSEGFAFEVDQKLPLKIYPHESEYISVTFKPTNVMPYSAIFEAVVDGGDTNPDTGVLRFELRGEGTLPTLQLDSPNFYLDDGIPLLKFNKTRLSKFSTGQIVLKNDGVVPATVKFDSLNSNIFSYNCPTTATIQPKNYMSFEIKFEPKQPGIEKLILSYKTMYNPFENPKLQLTGEGYFEPISFEGLDKENELTFGDMSIGQNKSLDFEIQNHSDKPYRFNFLNIYEPYFDVKPSVGIMLPGTAKEIRVTFQVNSNDIKDKDLTKDPIKFNGRDLFVETKQIKFNNKEMNWDNNMKIKKKVTNTEFTLFNKRLAEEAIKRKEEIESLFNIIAGVKKGQEKKKDEGKKKKEDEKPYQHKDNEEANIEIEDVVHEPGYTIIEKTEKYPSLKLYGTADYTRYQCNIKEVRFKPTMMYASRKHEFQLKNLSSIALHYSFSFTNPIYINNMNSNKDFINMNVASSMTSSNSNFHHQVQKYNPYNDQGPFIVQPRSGIIPPNSDESILVRFSPLEVDEMFFKRQLLCHIKDLDPLYKELNIELSGDSERPVCHFELQGGIKQENGYTILDFESIGMMVLNTKKFFVLNPTNLGYEFEWEQVDEDNPHNKMFKCATNKGVIFSGKKFEMTFEYLPTSLGQHESYWNFKVNSEKIVHKFLFVGVTRDPMILYNIGKVNFGPLLIGGKNKEIIQIINEEHLPYKFNFDKESIKGNINYGDSLFVNPMIGTLQPKSSTNIEITFMPRSEKEFNYNLSLKVKNRSKPLLLNVKGVGYTINHNVFLDNKPELKLFNKQEHNIDFGEFFIKEKRERSIILENNGAFNFHYVFKKNGADYLKITPDSGTVKKSEKLIINLTILPLTKINLKNHKIFMQIVSGPVYTFQINAKARSPQLQFSCTKVDFNQIYIQRPPQPITYILSVKNLDKEALTIETNFESKNTPHLDVLLSTGQVILPFQSKSDILEIPIIFLPREIKKYREIINFKFNGIYDQEIEILGEGIPIKLEIEENIQVLNFGIIQLGQNKKLDFSLVNRGKMKLDIQILPENRQNFTKRCLLMTSVDPDKTYKLDSKQVLKIELLFNPNIRIPLFNEELLVKINNNDTRKLISISGASYGVDVKMVGDLPPFGTVVANSMTQRSITLKNFGDLIAKFKWESPQINNPKKDYSKFFTFSPAFGSIPPHEEIQITITFHPKIVDNNIYFEKIKCNIENFDPISINLYGKSCDVPKEAITEKRLETEVRIPISYEIKIKNTTDKNWRITPSISTNQEQFVNYFKGEHSFEVKSGQESSYIINYTPLTMSKDKEHEATVFFPLPDGTARVHKLFGIANEPKAKKVINETSKAREWKILKIELQNWLYTSQRFKVSWKVDKQDPCIFIKGANTIDIGGNSTKEYKLSFRSWKEISCIITINFENPETKEYLYYQINMSSQTADQFSVTTLSGQVRELVTNNLTIVNPLKEDISIQSNQLSCDNEYVLIKPNAFTIKAESEISIELIYRPLLVNQINSMITIKSPELGDLKYPLILKGTQLPPPKQLQTISTTLGSEKIVTFNFIHYLKKATQYSVKIEKISENMPNTMDFIPEPTVLNIQSADMNKGVEVVSTVKYEPYFIGENRAYLKVSSPEAGEHVFILVGVCNSPQAQGPLKIPINKAYTYEFKNPLVEAAEINVRFDNPSFSCTKLNPKVDPKKSIMVQIFYKPVSPDSISTGRMIITLNKLPPWIIYLQTE